MTDSYRIRLECEKCHNGMILTIRFGTLIHQFECYCGHVTAVHEIPARPPDQPAAEQS